VDGSDTFETRAAVAAACESLGIPLVWGVLQEFHAQVTVFWSAPPAGIDPVVLSDLHPADEVGTPPTCAEVGVLGALCLQVGGILAVEAIKLIVGTGEPLLGRVLVIDALRGTQTEVALRGLLRRSDDAAPIDAPAAAAPAAIRELTASEMLAAQEAGATLLDVREPWETQTGVVAGSVLIPLGDLLTIRRRSTTSTSSSSVRTASARHAADALRARGVDADILVGGLAAWQQS
jgi:adenylyltransferase/sulfurtransferase